LSKSKQDEITYWFTLVLLISFCQIQLLEITSIALLLFKTLLDEFPPDYIVDIEIFHGDCTIDAHIVFEVKKKSMF